MRSREISCYGKGNNKVRECGDSRFVVLPYVPGVSEKIGRILNQHKVKVAYKPQQTINSLFPRPKGLDDCDRQKSGMCTKSVAHSAILCSMAKQKGH